jgi:hypothetical protein
MPRRRVLMRSYIGFPFQYTQTPYAPWQGQTTGAGGLLRTSVA